MILEKNSIVQGDAYVLPIVITAGSVFITDQLATAVRIKIGKYSAIWPGGKISYSNQKWLFPLTQEQTQELSSGQNEYQVQVQFQNGETVGTKPQKIYIQKSVLRGTFGAELSATEPSGFIELNQLNAYIADVNIEVTEGGGGGDIPDNVITTDMLGANLVYSNGKVNVVTANEPEQDNTKPITAAAVYDTIGNINALLSTI